MPLNFKNLTVLIVEDTVPMRKLLHFVMESLDVGKIYTADNGESGFEIFTRENPDIVIADWVMSPMNGIELTRMIRTHERSPNRMAPIILVTGYSAMNRVAEARDAGVTEFMIKPFSANDIAKRIAYVINKPRDFIQYSGYFGPDRRRKVTEGYGGPFRRKDDKQG